jgi:hypothetical protein
MPSSSVTSGRQPVAAFSFETFASKCSRSVLRTRAGSTSIAISSPRQRANASTISVTEYSLPLPRL